MNGPRVPQSLERVATGLDSFNRWIGRTVSWLTLGMVAVTCVVVLLRYVFSIGWIWMQETVTWMHGMVFMLGAAYTLSQNGHVRVDIVYRKVSEQRRALIDILGTILFLLPACLFIFFSSLDYVGAAWAVQETSREAGGLPGLYLLKTVIPLCAALLCLQGLVSVIRNAAVLVGGGHLEASDESPKV